MNDELLKRLQELKAEFPELGDKRIDFEGETPFEIIKEEKRLCNKKGEKNLEVIMGPSHKIQVRSSSIHGYGVFAKETILSGELIEEAKGIRLSNRSAYQYDKNLNDYIFRHSDCKCEECSTHGSLQFVGMGYSSLYNHSEESNATYKIDYEHDVIRITAKKDINEGEEILIDYGKNYWLMRKIWAGFMMNV
ncbi:SET domain-containing protein [Algoriphagus boseongensis]|uniref:SET domain-containing protein n=1 Tax=Algoriphagus boseongensis TaxID=1442587 RepID=A0A4R6T8N1_9BACT|nr:SET domain-containing protein-lysine N-methyltransferase [Algoriphagus boseongensis]TDQ19390.1 SET domain-containing protein [Algoriphagus boseongensis]